MRDDEDEDEDLPTGCSCCLGAIMLPVLFFIITFILMWLIPFPG